MNNTDKRVSYRIRLPDEGIEVLKPRSKSAVTTTESEILETRQFRDIWRGLEAKRLLHLFSFENRWVFAEVVRLKVQEQERGRYMALLDTISPRWMAE